MNLSNFRLLDRPSPPIGGSVVTGMSDGLAAAAVPARHLDSDPTLFLGIWLAGDPDVVEISGGRIRSLATSATAHPRRRQGGRHPRRLLGFDRPACRHPLEGDDLQGVSRSPARALSRNLTLPPMSAIPTPTTCPRPAAWAAGLPCCMRQRRRLERPRD